MAAIAPTVQEQLEARGTAAVGQLQDGSVAVLPPIVAKGLTDLGRWRRWKMDGKMMGGFMDKVNLRFFWIT